MVVVVVVVVVASAAAAANLSTHYSNKVFLRIIARAITEKLFLA